jgi:enoyl-[acyl-carrier-protein] reductase (NADH)
VHVELGPLGVRVNLISPGAVAGPRIEGVIREQASAAGISYEAVYEEATKTTPLRRLIPPEDIAVAAIFLASDASASTTGADLNVSGGLAMHWSPEPRVNLHAGRALPDDPYLHRSGEAAIELASRAGARLASR